MKIYTESGLLTNLQKYLTAVDETKMFYTQHKLKHPLIYCNTSLWKIETTLRYFLDVYESSNMVNVHDINHELLLKGYKQFLYSVREYLDDCFHILKSFFPPSPKKDKDRNQANWLKNHAGKYLKGFFVAIENYKKYIDNIVNELKHNNGILYPIAMYQAENFNNHILGYFVGNSINGVLSPVEKIHSLHDSTTTAFSYSRDLTYNIYHVFFLAEEVFAVLNSIAPTSFGNVSIAQNNYSDRLSLYTSIGTMRKMYFNDEYFKPIPNVSIPIDNRLELEFPSSVSLVPNTMKGFFVAWSGDGHTRSFNMPYVKAEDDIKDLSVYKNSIPSQRIF